jgi:tellurite resistance protein TerC
MQFAKLTSKEVKSLPLVKAFKKIFPVTGDYHGDKFFVRIEGGLWATPMVVLVIAVESFDVMFAIDSIPAILAITTDPFIVFSSNVFAILGLRALFFLLSRLMKLFKYLKTGVAVILAFVGIKMLLSDLFHIPVSISLAFIASILTISILASLLEKNLPNGKLKRR